MALLTLLPETHTDRPGTLFDVEQVTRKGGFLQVQIRQIAVVVVGGVGVAQGAKSPKV